MKEKAIAAYVFKNAFVFVLLNFERIKFNYIFKEIK